MFVCNCKRNGMIHYMNFNSLLFVPGILRFEMFPHLHKNVEIEYLNY